MNEEEKTKAEKAAAALRAVGIESAWAENTSVSVTPEDAMKLLLLTDSDTVKLVEFAERARHNIAAEVGNVKAKLDRLQRLAGHSPELCKKGDHVLDSFATGGRNGHVLTRCLCCDYSVDGYD